MILTRTPFRVSFAGGGSDLPEFYRRQTGTVVSTTIDEGMEIVSFADVPSGTGMGSSSAFTVGLLQALYARGGKPSAEGSRVLCNDGQNGPMLPAAL